MALDPDDLRALRAAYQTLGVPHDATALAIRHAYRRLAKQWHPDKWTAGSEAQGKAGDRMRELNDAYRLALHAPLRYHVESHPRVEARAERRGKPAPRPTIKLNDTGEYIARFVLGTLVGGLVSLVLLWTQTTESVPLLVAIPPVTGLLSIAFGDAFWGFLVEFLWWWP